MGIPSGGAGLRSWILCLRASSVVEVTTCFSTSGYRSWTRCDIPASSHYEVLMGFWKSFQSAYKILFVSSGGLAFCGQSKAHCGGNSVLPSLCLSNHGNINTSKIYLNFMTTESLKQDITTLAHLAVSMWSFPRILPVSKSRYLVLTMFPLRLATSLLRILKAVIHH